MFSVDLEKVSMVHWFPDLERHTCGYCKTENGAVSYGMWAEQLTVDDYQNLIDRGWRRSGKYCYKPIMDLTCCPQYTIRCNTLDFKLTKSQKKIIKRFNKFIGDGIGCKEVQENDETMDVVPHEYAIVKQKPNISIDRTKKINICNPVTTIEASDAPTTSYATTEKTVSLLKVWTGKSDMEFFHARPRKEHCRCSGGTTKMLYDHAMSDGKDVLLTSDVLDQRFPTFFVSDTHNKSVEIWRHTQKF